MYYSLFSRPIRKQVICLFYHSSPVLSIMRSCPICYQDFIIRLIHLSKPASGLKSLRYFSFTRPRDTNGKNNCNHAQNYHFILPTHRIRITYCDFLNSTQSVSFQLLIQSYAHYLCQSLPLMRFTIPSYLFILRLSFTDFDILIFTANS